MTRKPLLIKKGDKVGIIAPGGAFNREKFNAGVAFIKKLGLIPVYAPHLFKKDLIFAGSVKERVSSLKKMLMRKDINILWCVRGGYGTYAVAQELGDFRHQGRPKIVLGQSDILALHMLCLQKWKWPILHSPLLDRAGVEQAKGLEQDVLTQTLLNHSFRLEISKGLKTLGKKGEVTGVLTGGNLAMMVASLKTKWEIQTKNKILFFEEIGERAYRVDRLLFQLKVAGKLDGIKAVVIGDFTGCEEPDGKEIWKEIIKRHFKNSPVPVLWGIHAGHGSLRLTLPMGVKVRVNTTSRPYFKVLESYARGK